MLTIRHNRKEYADRTLKNASVDDFLVQPVAKKKPKFPEGSMGLVLDEICAKYHTTPQEVLSKQRFKNISQARAEFIAVLHFKHSYSLPRLSHLMDMDITSVRHILGLRKDSKRTYADLREQFK